MTTPLLLALPWALALALFLAAVRVPRRLPAPDEAQAAIPDPPPLVSVVIPARDEAHNIARVVESVTRSSYPRFEVIVVDDQSGDGTGEIARGLDRGRAERLEVVSGQPLPEGWLGKPWSCAQGARSARGSVLLFTDADTVHDPGLLTRAVAGLALDRADALTVLGRQLMDTFWERVIQPAIFFMLLARFQLARWPLGASRWRDAIANGQYLLFRREVYDRIGGHEAVKGEVVEDLRLAQILVKGGWQLSLREAEAAFATRMYRDLRELLRGWTKNVAIGARQTVPPWARPALIPGSILLQLGFWVAPVLVLGVALAGLAPPALLVWSAAVVAACTLFWCVFVARMGVPIAYGALYPLGAVMTVVILVRSWLRGNRVEWKGREYRVRALRD